jgi:hypothetical protein
MKPRAAFHSVLCSFVGLFLSVRVGAAESDPCRSVNFEGKLLDLDTIVPEPV